MLITSVVILGGVDKVEVLLEVNWAEISSKCDEKLD